MPGDNEREKRLIEAKAKVREIEKEWDAVLERLRQARKEVTEASQAFWEAKTE